MVRGQIFTFFPQTFIPHTIMSPYLLNNKINLLNLWNIQSCNRWCNYSICPAVATQFPNWLPKDQSCSKWIPNRGPYEILKLFQTSATSKLKILSNKLLTTFNHHWANLNIMWVRFEFHRTRQHQCQSKNRNYSRCITFESPRNVKYLLLAHIE